MIPGNWNKVKPIEEGRGPGLPAGGYVIRMRSPYNDISRQGLKIEYDIAEGEYTGYYAKLHERFPSFWGGSFFSSYKESAERFFRGFIEAVELSNPGVKIILEDGSIDETRMSGLLVGIILREEEDYSNSGEVKTYLRKYALVQADKIRSGDFKVPPKKLLEKKITPEAGEVVDMSDPASTFEQIDAELPF